MVTVLLGRMGDSDDVLKRLL